MLAVSKHSSLTTQRSKELTLSNADDDEDDIDSMSSSDLLFKTAHETPVGLKAYEMADVACN